MGRFPLERFCKKTGISCFSWAVLLVLAVLINVAGVHNIPVTFMMSAYEPAHIVRDGSVRVAVEGWKIRRCELVKGTREPFILLDNGWTREGVTFSFGTGPSQVKEYSRAIGRHDFGEWKWDYAGRGNPLAVMLRVTHICKNSLFQRGVIGPFSVIN